MTDAECTAELAVYASSMDWTLTVLAIVSVALLVVELAHVDWGAAAQRIAFVCRAAARVPFALMRLGRRAERWLRAPRALQRGPF